MNFRENLSLPNNSHFPEEERKKKKLKLKKNEWLNQRSMPSRRQGFSKSDEDMKCLCCLSCPEALSSEWMGLGRGQKSWLGFHSNSLYRIPFHGFRKERKWMDYVRIMLFSMWEGIWIYMISKIQNNSCFLNNCFSQIAVSTEELRRQSFIFSNVLFGYFRLRVEWWLSLSNFKIRKVRKTLERKLRLLFSGITWWIIFRRWTDKKINKYEWICKSYVIFPTHIIFSEIRCLKVILNLVLIVLVAQENFCCWKNLMRKVTYISIFVLILVLM